MRMLVFQSFGMNSWTGEMHGKHGKNGGAPAPQKLAVLNLWAVYRLGAAMGIGRLRR